MTQRIHARSVDGLTTDGSGAVKATAVTVTPTGTIAATDVQAALAELDGEKAGAGHTHGGASSGRPWTSVTTIGEPVLMWDDNNILMMTEES